MSFDAKRMTVVCVLLSLSILAFGACALLVKSPDPISPAVQTTGQDSEESTGSITTAPSTTAPIVTVPPVTTAPVTTAPPATAPVTTAPPATETTPQTEPSIIDTWPDFPTLSLDHSWTATPTVSPVPSSEYPDHVQVVKREGCVEHRAFHDFYLAGVKATVKYDYSDSVPYGRLLFVELDGFENDESYFVKLKTPVVLHVSAGKQGASTYANRGTIFFLTFDDGPTPYTDDVINLLAQYNIKATFFAVGFQMDAFSYQIKPLLTQGHALGCHSFTHEFPDIYLTTDSLMKEVLRWERELYSIMGGVTPYRLFRFPGGSSTDYLGRGRLAELRKALNAVGYSSYDWNCANNDAWDGMRYEGEAKDAYLKRQLKTTLSWLSGSYEYRVCLMHETNSVTRETLQWAIEHVIDQGYCFRTLDLVSQDQLFLTD